MHLLDVAEELAFYGAKVLHRKALFPLRRAAIPLAVRNSARSRAPAPGSITTASRTGAASPLAPRRARELRVGRQGGRRRGAVDWIVLQQSGLGGFLGRGRGQRCRCGRSTLGGGNWNRTDGVALVAAVGHELRHTTSAEAIRGALRDAGVKPFGWLDGSSPHSVAALIAESELRRAVQAVHATLVQPRRELAAAGG